MRNIKLLIEYDGTNYYGWQRQKNVNNTIQQAIEDSIWNLTKENIDVIGCSRTDTGVHANGFIANFTTTSKVPGEKFQFALNNRLPEDIIILNSEEVSLNFHSRFNSIGKRYIYKVLNRKWCSAIMRNYTYHVKNHLDLQKMNEAASYLIGRHDFTSFRNLGSSVKSSIRTITDISVFREGDIINISVSGDGFLYNMVRIIVGTLLDVGMGKKMPKDIKDILNSLNRVNAGKTAPAKGLYLDEVFY
ncbi:tRNA pseudouridine(38-40) synthase TruA [Clostridium rectalis]|uniref:tRNA pseudouridine(38-40) synthase TruA n=1 Tax=Clostridium rectalis TaxID=2040295 RepID=UPI000F64377F|nr:tRNA pseudouridine(38-40) synthase TruA [Clostridium rectalis]